jgi:hypothetical protein
MSAARRAAMRMAVAGASSVLAGGVAAAAVATIFARRVVTPDSYRPDDVDVLEVGDGTVTLRATVETVVPGRYGLWLDGGTGHARLGPVRRHDERAGTVTRELVQVDSGRLVPGRARWNQYYYAGTPATIALAYEDVDVPGEAGPMPAWLVPAGSGERWAILVHGRGATREECLRALPVLQRLGITALVISYRTTAGLPGAPVLGRYHLGDREPHLGPIAPAPPAPAAPPAPPPRGARFSGPEELLAALRLPPRPRTAAPNPEEGPCSTDSSA